MLAENFFVSSVDPNSQSVLLYAFAIAVLFTSSLFAQLFVGLMMIKLWVGLYRKSPYIVSTVHGVDGLQYSVYRQSFVHNARVLRTCMSGI